MAFVKLDENNVVIEKVLRNHNNEYIEAPDNVSCGQVKQSDGSFVQPEPIQLPYDMLRKAEYDKLNQFEMQFNDQRDGTTTWVDAINDIKARYPK